MSLEAVLRLSGAQPDPYAPHKWHTAHGALSVNGARFFHWGQGRGGAIDLAMHLHGLDFRGAIDALSCAVLHPGYTCLSTAGARPNPRWLAPLAGQGHQVYCGFDSDPTGEAMAAAMMRDHPTVRRLRPALHDWNDVLHASL